METKTVRKWWFVWDFEKEEQWLNTLAMEGWILHEVSFCKYTFVKGTPGEYIVRLEMHGSDDDYMSFMGDIGAEYIGRYGQWLYFKRKSELGSFDIFSDIDSKVKHLKKISKALWAINIANLIIGMGNTFNGMKVGIVNLLCVCLMTYAIGRIDGQASSLETERVLHE